MSNQAGWLVIVDSVLRGDIERSFNDPLYSYLIMNAQYRNTMTLLLAGEAALLALRHTGQAPAAHHRYDESAGLLIENLEYLLSQGVSILVLMPDQIAEDTVLRDGIRRVTPDEIADLVVSTPGTLFL